MIAKISFIKNNSVKSGNLCKSVIPTITKVHEGHQVVETEKSRGSKFLIKLTLT